MKLHSLDLVSLGNRNRELSEHDGSCLRDSLPDHEKLVTNSPWPTFNTIDGEKYLINAFVLLNQF